MRVLYLAEATAAGGRTGRVVSSDGRLNVALGAPEECGGTCESCTNPEQLFAAGYAACFLGALKFVARRLGIAIGETMVTAKVGISGREDEAGFGLGITLNVDFDGVDREEARTLIELAETVCPYSDMVRNGAPVGMKFI